MTRSSFSSPARSEPWSQRTSQPCAHLKQVRAVVSTKIITGCWRQGTVDRPHASCRCYSGSMWPFRPLQHPHSYTSFRPGTNPLSASSSGEAGASCPSSPLSHPHETRSSPAHLLSISSLHPGLTPGCKALLLASLASEVQAVRQAVDLPGLRGFDDELRRAARRRRAAGTGARNQPPKGEPAAADVYEGRQLVDGVLSVAQLAV